MENNNHTRFMLVNTHVLVNTISTGKCFLSFGVDKDVYAVPDAISNLQR